MTETTIVSLVGAFLAAIPPTLVAWAALSQGRRTNEKAVETSRKADVIIEKAVEIHSLTNSRLSEVTAELHIANEKIVGLEKLISEMTKRTEEKP